MFKGFQWLHNREIHALANASVNTAPEMEKC